MKYLKLFEAFISKPIFYRFNHSDLLNDKDELIYQPKERRMIGPDDINNCLLKANFPDKSRCIHFMDSLAFNPKYKGLYGEYLYEIEINEDSKLGWSFLVPINEWFYKGFSSMYGNVLGNHIIKDLLNSEYKNMNYDDGDLDEIRDIVMEFGFIGTGTIKDLKMSPFFENQPVFVWTTDNVKITRYIEEPKAPKIPKSYKKEPLLTKKDFLDFNITSNQIGEFYSSDWGKRFKEIDDSLPFEKKRKEALELLKNWKESL
jgi:hypothetical protein